MNEEIKNDFEIAAKVCSLYRGGWKVENNELKTAISKMEEIICFVGSKHHGERYVCFENDLKDVLHGLQNRERRMAYES